MDVAGWIILTLVSLAFSALFSGVETAYITSDRVRVGMDLARGGVVNAILNRYFNHREFFISTVLVGNNIMLVIYGMGAAAVLDPWLRAHVTTSPAVMLLLSTLASTLVILLVGEFFPKSLTRLSPRASLKVFALPVFLFYVVLAPVSWFTSWLSRLLMRVFGVKDDDKGLGALSITDLNSYLEKTIDDVDSPEPTQVENEVKIFHNALDFSTTQVRDCMAPRNELIAVDIDEVSRPELSDLFTRSGRSKIVVYRQDIDNVLGYIHVSELFDPASDWKTHVKEVLYAPETLLANTMMRRLLAEKCSMAVVVDEFGGTSGIVTLEDLVEEIFGDIQDEHDKSQVTAVEVAQGVYDFSGRIEVRQLRDDYRIDIPEDDAYQTLAGYIMARTGELPPQDASIDIDGITFTIRRRTATRLDLVRVQLQPAQGE